MQGRSAGDKLSRSKAATLCVHAGSLPVAHAQDMPGCAKSVQSWAEARPIQPVVSLHVTLRHVGLQYEAAGVHVLMPTWGACIISGIVAGHKAAARPIIGQHQVVGVIG